MSDIGKNLVMHAVTGDEVVLVVDLTKDFGPSSSGATRIIATTSGNKPLGQSGAVLGINVFTKSELPAGTLFEATTEPKSIGLGTKFSLSREGVMTVTLKLAGPGKPSSSGKSTLLCSASEKGIGGVAVTLNVNCYITDITKLDVTRLSAGATFDVDASDLSHIRLTARLDGSSGEIVQPLRAVAETGLKMTGVLRWDARKGSTTTPSKVTADGEGNAASLTVDATSRTVTLLFDGTAPGTLDRPSGNQLTVATIKATPATHSMLAHLGVTQLDMSLLKPTAVFLVEALQSAAAEYFHALSSTELETVGFKAARAAIKPLFEARCAAARVVCPNVEGDAELMGCLRDTLSQLVLSKGLDKRSRPSDE